MITVAPLANHPEHAATLARWFAGEWPAHYAPRGGEAAALVELADAADLRALPIALIALDGASPVGTASLRECWPAHSDPTIGPWLGGLFVAPAHRRRGIATRLIAATARLARSLGHARLYVATAHATALFERAGWTRCDTLVHDGETVHIYARSL